MKFWWLFIPLWWATGAWAVPPAGMPLAVEGYVFSGSAVGLNGLCEIRWNDLYGVWILQAGDVTIEVFEQGPALYFSMNWSGGYHSDNTYWLSDGFVSTSIWNGEPSGTSEYFVFIPRRVVYGIGTEIWPTLDMIWAGVASAIVLFFIASWIGVVLREVGVLKRF